MIDIITIENLQDFVHTLNNQYTEPMLFLDPNGKLRLTRGTYKHQRQFDSLCSYINNLFKRYSRLLVVRMDLKYTQEYSPYCSIEQATKDLKHFLLNRRANNLFKHMVGYVWKFEQGSLYDGLHFHCLFFFNSAYVKNYSYYANEIGQYWQSVITKNRGIYRYFTPQTYNQMHYPAVGVIHRSDVSARLGLFNLMAYLSKPDQAVDLAPNYRSIGYGQLPKRI